MADEVKVPGSNAFLQSIAKLEDTEGWTRWKKKMRDYLILVDFYYYIKKLDLFVHPVLIVNARLTHKQRHMKTCTAMRTRLGYNAYSIVEDITNASKVWAKIEKKYKPRASGISNSMFQKLDSLTLAGCINHSNYVNQYKKAINKLKDMSLHLQFDTNFFIYWFHSDLGILYNSYVSHYIQTYDIFDRENKAAFTLKYAIRQFLNTCKNPTSNTSEFSQALVTAKKPKPIKYTHYKKTRHTANKCWEKHPHLKPIHIIQKESYIKQKQDDDNNNDNTLRPKKPDGSSYLAAIKQCYYIAMELPMESVALIAESKKHSLIKNLTPVTKDDFVLDTACSQHAVHNRIVFTFYEILNLFQNIKGYAGTLKAIGIGQNLLSCNVNSKLTQMGFSKALHISDVSINLISYRQLESLCFMHLVPSPQ